MNNLSTKFRDSQLAKVMLIAILVMLLQIPVYSINDLTSERRHTRDAAFAEIAGKWGGKQVLIGPRLVVPYDFEEVQIKGDIRRVVKHRHYLSLLPRKLNVVVNMQTEFRKRGLYEIPLYAGDAHLTGNFDISELTGRYENAELRWELAHIVTQLSDARALRGPVQLSIGEKPLELLPGGGNLPRPGGAFHGEFELDPKTSTLPFELKLRFGGSRALRVVPLGRESTISIKGDWADPSFQGGWLPSTREVSDTGFAAEWQIPFLGRSFPQLWNATTTNHRRQLTNAAVGLHLLSPTDAYVMSHRSVKYAMLFIALTFISFWLIELLGGARLHPMHYLFTGAALVLFYLLQLSLAEHIGYLAAYVLAGFAISAMVALYAGYLVKSRRMGMMIGAGLVLLYGYLLTLLQEQRYSLLAGSLGLLALLGAAMYLTRRIEWSLPAPKAPLPEPSPEELANQGQSA